MWRVEKGIAYNTSSGEDVHATTFSIIFETLSGYSWEAILILTLTAFALNYGECWHLALIYSSNQLGKSMAILKQVADVHKLSGLSAPPLEAVNDLVKAIMDVTRCIIEFQELGSQLDGSKDVEAYSAGLRQIPLTIYWIIRSVLASASQITSLTSLAFNYVISSTEKEELIFLTEKLNKKKKELKEQQNLCYPILDKATMNKRLGIIKSLLELPQVDNMNILRALIYYKDDQQPLIDGSNRKVDLDVLRKKLILLLISDVDIPQEDINVVKQIYHKSRDEGQIIKAENQFEIVWLPIVDSSMFTSSDYVNRKFKEKRSNMPWYSVNQPSLIAQEVVKLTREEWHFDKHPIIVVLDAQGQLLSNVIVFGGKLIFCVMMAYVRMVSELISYGL
ncbi:protein SIEVE ELEMENT OCCLUSION B-like [Mercurialis annua]|uniref:protein SIEVE ELEMENT OCCLUSION B-like n=1 Tax=Mercurialis annua TaxID=3986 RepID=UPI0024AD735D|nr:protein SIEVE ELEMENT OCCLUSION B-like [Mercurialis annua]